ncbi:aldehyde dehydrogenase family protein [Streptomyces violaceusniger]
MAMTPHHWRNGKAFEGTADRFPDVTNPATGEVTAHLALATEDDVNAVVEAAAAAFPPTAALWPAEL